MFMTSASFSRVSLSSALIMAVVCMAACTADPPHEQPDFRIEPPIEAAAAAQAVPLFTVGLDRIAELAARQKKQVMTVQDPVYEEARAYEGVALTALIDAARPAGVPAVDAMRLVFRTGDGYRSVTTVRRVQEFNGFLAIRDMQADSNQLWRPIPGKSSMTPAPYYLVWPNANADLPWPYAITAIEVWDREPVDLTAPDDDAAANAGHAVFKKRCMSCHAVNGTGGTLGPELNVPANVTEYWNRTALKQFILDPSSIRNAPKMPTLGLPEAEVDAVIAYLVRMKTLKRIPRRP